MATIHDFAFYDSLLTIHLLLTAHSLFTIHYSLLQYRSLRAQLQHVPTRKSNQRLIR